MKRNNQLDGIRGFLIVIMLMDHFEGPLYPYSYETFGFVSAAEGFIFISGLVAALVYSRKMMKIGFEPLKTMAKNRALTIYKYHIGLIACLAVLSFAFQPIADFWIQKVPSLFSQPVITLVLAVVFLFQPLHINILPMYVIFIFLVPYVLKRFFDNKAIVVFLISGFLYVLGQVKMLPALGATAQEYAPVQLSFFDIFAWQFLFLLGITVGFFEAKEYKLWTLFKRSNYTMILCCLMVLMVLPFRYQLIPADGSLYLALISKTHLGPVRVLNFLAIAFIINFLTRKFPKNIFTIPWFIYLGKHSLQVFSYHVLLIIIFLPFLPQIKSMGMIVETLFTLAMIISLYLPAYLHERYTTSAAANAGKRVSA